MGDCGVGPYHGCGCEYGHLARWGGKKWDIEGAWAGGGLVVAGVEGCLEAVPLEHELAVGCVRGSVEGGSGWKGEMRGGGWWLREWWGLGP